MTLESHYLKDELYELLQQDSSILDFLQNGSLDGLWYWDLENRDHEWMSPKFWTTLGYDPKGKEHLASEWQGLIHPDDLKVALDNFKRHCEDPKHPYDQVVRYRHKDGATVWIRCRGIAIRDKVGNPIRMLGTHTDLTSQKMAEEAFKESERFLGIIFDSIHDGINVLDMDMNIVRTNRAMRKWYAHILPLEGRKCYDAYQGRTQPCDFCPTLRALRTGKLEKAEVPHTHNGDIIGIFEVFAFPMHDDSGHPMGVVEYLHDITERKQMEEALHKSEERYREIVEGTDNLVTEVDVEGRFIFVNEASQKVFGLPPEKCIGRLAFEFIHPDDLEMTQNHFARWVAERKKSVTFENRQVSSSGQVRDMLWSINLFFDRNRNIKSIKSIARDITERKMAERELARYREHLEERVNDRTAELKQTNEKLQLEIAERKKAEEELRRYADAQTVLVREVNHRVKNNLSAIIGMLHMESDRAETKNAASNFTFLHDLVGRIQGLSTVHSLLSASGWRPLQISELCRQVVRGTLQGVPLGKAIDVEITPSDVQIESNQAHHLTLVVNELTTNTMKYALKKRQRANIRIDIHQSGRTVEMRFKDDGPGYPVEIIQGVFVPSSIGFELIRGIVRRSLNGDVVFSNEEGAVARIIFKSHLTTR